MPRDARRAAVRLRPLVVRVAAIAYPAVLTALLLMPAPTAIAPGHTDFLETDRLLSGRMGVRDLVLNIALFVPAGLLVRAGLRGLLPGALAPTVATLMAGSALSVGAEALQAVVPGRYSSAGDVAANVAGLVLGVLLDHLIASAPR